MKKFLLICSYPNSTSFNQAINKTAISKLKQFRRLVKVRGLYEMSFNPVLSTEDFVALQ